MQVAALPLHDNVRQMNETSEGAQVCDDDAESTASNDTLTCDAQTAPTPAPTHFGKADVADEQHSSFAAQMSYRDRWLLRSFLSGISRPASLQSGTSWDDELSDYDRQACKMVKSLFSQIDNVLFEHEDMPTSYRQLSDECGEWRRLFPHLRVLGSQLCTSVDLGYSFAPRSAEQTPREGAEGKIERTAAHGSPADAYFNSQTANSANEQVQDSTTYALRLSGATLNIFELHSNLDSTVSSSAEEIIEAEGSYEETLAIDSRSAVTHGLSAASNTYRERTVELLRQAELSMSTTPLKDRVMMQLFRVAWLTLASLMQPLLQTLMERKTRATSTKNRKVSAGVHHEDEDGNRLQDSDVFSNYIENSLNGASRQRIPRSKSSPWAGVIGHQLQYTHTSAYPTGVENAVAKQQTGVSHDAAEYINIVKPVKMAGRMNLARKMLVNVDQNYKINMVPDLPLMCSSQQMTLDAERQKILNSGRTENGRRQRPARLEPLIRSTSVTTDDAATPVAPNSRKPPRATPKTAHPNLSGFASPVRERSATLKPGMSTIEEGVVSTQCVSRLTDATDPIGLQRNASCLSVSSCQRSVGPGPASQCGTATPSTVKSKSPWVPWKANSPSNANNPQNNSTSLANTLRLLPTSGEVMRLNSVHSATPGAGPQRTRTAHPFSAKVYSASNEVTVFHEYYRRNFGIRGNGVSLNNRAGK